MQTTILKLLEELNPKSSDLERILGLKDGCMYSYTRVNQRRKMPVDVQDKLKQYLLITAKYVLSQLEHSALKESNNPDIVKKEIYYYPSGDGWVHFRFNGKYYMTDAKDIVLDGFLLEFNPDTKFPAPLIYKFIIQ